MLASFGGHRGQVMLGETADTAMVVVVGDEPRRRRSLEPACAVGFASRRCGRLLPDLLAASDVVLSKVGYGIVADCIANRIPLLYTHRGRFVEQDLFDHDLPSVLRVPLCRRIRHPRGTWKLSSQRFLTQPSPHQMIAVDGAAVVTNAFWGCFAPRDS